MTKKLEDRITALIEPDEKLIDSPIKKSKGKGGRRPGAGRPVGKKDPMTLEKERVLTAVKQRIMQAADVILDAQLSLARGQQFLYKIEKTKVIGPKGGVSYRSEKPELVTEKWEIEAYLEGRLTSGDMHDQNDPEATYYYITTKEPNNQAIEGMFNRALGKPIDGDGSDKPPFQLQVNIVQMLNRAYGANDPKRD